MEKEYRVPLNHRYFLAEFGESAENYKAIYMLYVLSRDSLIYTPKIDESFVYKTLFTEWNHLLDMGCVILCYPTMFNMNQVEITIGTFNILIEWEQWESIARWSNIVGHNYQ